MANNIKGFSESAKGFTKSPLGIIALFIVLVYGFASLVVSLGKNLDNNVAPLIYFLVIFPVIVFFGFLWLVVKHSKKLYGPSDFKDEDNFVKMQMVAAKSLVAATAKQPNSTINSELSQKQIEKIFELVSRTSKREQINSLENKILWVDDNPDNNIYERKAFESQGIEFDIALTTDGAMTLLKTFKYAAIISDMGRKEGAQEGYVLLEKVRKMGLNIPFFIYAGSNLPEHKIMAKERDAQGTTNRADELYKMVMDAITD